jgi:hypothetical protein
VAEPLTLDPGATEALARERAQVARAHAVLAATVAALQAQHAGREPAQALVLRVADMALAAWAAESALARAAQAVAGGGEAGGEAGALHRALAALVCAEAARIVAGLAAEVAAASGGAPPAALSDSGAETAPAVDVIGLRRTVAAALVAAERYPLGVAR